MKKFYVYKIFHEIEKKYYVGSRTISNKIDILNGYNTSSKVVHNLIDEYGIDKFKLIEVIELTSAKKAIEKEDEILKSIKNKEDYLNINFSAGGAIIKSQTHIQIYNSETDEYMYHPKKVKIPQGWIKKSSFKPPSRKGFRTIINTFNHETKIINTLVEIIPDGWEIKTDYDKKIHNSIEKRTEWITDEYINKKIRKSDKLPDGWRFGKISKRIRNMKITNGIETIYINSNEELPDGWRIGQHHKGCSTTKNTITINNGIVNKHIMKDDEIPQGWIRGQLPTSKNKIYKIDDKEFFYKKDVIKYLKLTPSKFDNLIKKNKLKIEIKERI